MGEIFGAIERGLGSALAFLYDVVPSFGVAIILLTVAINIVLFPLTLKQTRATRAFQEIQPEIKRIQKELKDTPEEMQKELMRVQREAGATPLGCLFPMLVQFPIWLALFRVLRAANAAAIEGGESFIPQGSGLAQAILEGRQQFLGMDLGVTMSDGVLGGSVTRAIPYVLMLVLMVATQYVQQWHAMRGQTSTPGNKQQQQTQQAITRIMPLFIGFISWSFPVGLVLYWTTSNLFRLVQQVVIFKIDGRPSPPSTSGTEEPAKESGEEQPRRPQPGSKKRKRRRRR